MDEESTLEIDPFGNKSWKNKQRELHRLDGPAVEYVNGYKEWWQNGCLHREDGPAILYDDDGGSKSWFLNDILYRAKEDYFNALSDEAKSKCLFSEDFLNG
jgi:hypothetical protein